MSSATRSLSPCSGDFAAARFTTAYLYISQLAAISGGRSPIHHLGTRLVACRKALTTTLQGNYCRPLMNIVEYIDQVDPIHWSLAPSLPTAPPCWGHPSTCWTHGSPDNNITRQLLPPSNEHCWVYRPSRPTHWSLSPLLPVIPPCWGLPSTCWTHGSPDNNNTTRLHRCCTIVNIVEYIDQVDPTHWWLSPSLQAAPPC